MSEQSQYTYYNSALNSRTNITSVEETATRLGLMKIDQSQITYIRLDEIPWPAVRAVPAAAGRSA